MSATLIALALFGCSDDGTACERLQAPVKTFATQSECFARLDDAVQSETARRAEFPSVYAQCMTKRELAELGTGVIDLTKVNKRSLAAAEPEQYVQPRPR
jgi:hypothetical protein